MAEVPQVSDPAKDTANLRRFTSIVSILLNSLLDSGQIVRTGPNTFSIVSGAGILTTKGDLLTYDTGLVRLPVGADTFVLTANSADAKGVTWAALPSGQTDPISSIYPPFTVTGDSDEFSAVSFSGWTAVNSGSHAPTLTQANNRISILHPGGDASAELHAWMKTTTVNAGDYIETGFQILSSNQLCLAGLIMADGTTYGSGVNVCLDYSPFETNAIRQFRGTGYSTLVDQSSLHILDVTRASDMFLRLKYLGSNNWEGYISCDGISWLLALSFSTIGLTPTAVGFFVTTWGSANPALFSFRYFKHAS